MQVIPSSPFPSIHSTTIHAFYNSLSSFILLLMRQPYFSLLILQPHNCLVVMRPQTPFLLQKVKDSEGWRLIFESALVPVYSNGGYTTPQEKNRILIEWICMVLLFCICMWYEVQQKSEQEEVTTPQCVLERSGDWRERRNELRLARFPHSTTCTSVLFSGQES